MKIWSVYNLMSNMLGSSYAMRQPTIRKIYNINLRTIRLDLGFRIVKLKKI